MKTLNVKQLIVSLPLLLGAGSVLAAGQDVLFACTASDGSIAVSSVANGDNCERIAAPAQADVAPAAAPNAAVKKENAGAASQGASPGQAATGKPAADAPGPAAAELPPMETRLSNYRDTMLQGASKAQGAPAAAANPAVNRRYLMTNRAAYRASH